MTGVDLQAARAFMAGHARVLDRKRLALALGEGGEAAALAAVDAYRNEDAGYGWGIEPDLRSESSQPVGAMHAMEVFAECAPSGADRAVELCGWLERQSLADGGIPFALPVSDPVGTSPIWAGADPAKSSLQMTSQLAAHAHRIARHDPAIGAHPWLQAATNYCLGEIAAMDEAPHAFALMFCLRFLDAAAPHVPEADAALDRLAAYVPADGVAHVAGGLADEKLHPLDLSPWPGAPSRRLFDEHVFDSDLTRLATLQQRDGGWIVEFETSSAAAALEWRGYATVSALAILRAHGFGGFDS